MSQLQVELPVELMDEVAQRSGREPGRESAWIAEAVRERLAACSELDYLEQRSAKGSRVAYERILAKVPAVPPVTGDEK